MCTTVRRLDASSRTRLQNGVRLSTSSLRPHKQSGPLTQIPGYSPNTSTFLQMSEFTQSQFHVLPATVTVRSCSLSVSLSLFQFPSGCWSIIWWSCRDFRESHACAEAPPGTWSRPSLLHYTEVPYVFLMCVYLTSHLNLKGGTGSSAD